jgi:hypothetical protein
VGGALIVAPMALVPSFELMLALAVLLGLVEAARSRSATRSEA